MIGVFDSGFGGLQTLKYLRVAFPHEDFLFLADNANVPYGDKSEEEIKLLTVKNVEWLLSQRCHHVVIACNTAVASIYYDWFVKETTDKLIGVTQCGVADVVAKNYKNIAVFCTQATHDLLIYPSLYNELGGKGEIYTVPTFELVPLIESENVDYNALYRVIESYRKYITPDTDCIILGCTHYPILIDLFWEHFPQCSIVDPGRSVLRFLDMGLLAKQCKKNGGRGTTSIMCTALHQGFTSGVRRIWKTEPIPSIAEVSV